ncbi:MAG: O-antigen ligase family protein, partial [Anaerolineales bacterium]|nr:O-antigen ligase family protein [Anaerolineales bacterium]
MHRFVENHWFALSELVWVMAAGVTWALVPQLGWRLLPVALLPWLLRLAGGQFPFKRTRFDFLILVFLLTAVVGAWAAYDREAALAKFYLLVAGMLLFYALASQPKDNVWLVAGLFAAFGAGVAIFFLLTYDWQTDPAKINLIQQAAVWWMGRRPNFLAGTIHHNTAGGILAITAPFLIALLSYASRGRMILLTVWVLMAGALLIIGLLFTTSRGAWIGLTAGLGVWVLWLVSGKLSGRFQWKRSGLFGVGIMVSCILVFGLFALYPGGVIDLAGELAGPDSAVTRLDLAQNGLKLLGDFSFSGGGLGAFAGLYSHYIRAIPFFYFDYSHNLLLDIALEQG